MRFRVTLSALFLVCGLSLPWEALAGRFEFSSGFSFNRTSYGDDSFSWSRRIGLTFGYHFTERSEVELSFQDVVNRNQIVGYEDTTFHDRIYALNWTQSVLGKGYVVDPYFKLGIGQLNRDASGSYAFGGSPSTQVDSVTGIFGLGLRISLSNSFGIRTEANTYLTGARLSTWKDNGSFNAGFSIFF